MDGVNKYYTVSELLEILSNYLEADALDSYHIQEDLTNVQDSCNYWLDLWRK